MNQVDRPTERGLSVRWRLTVVYASVAVASAAVLLSGIYVLVSLQQTGDPFDGAIQPITTELPPPEDDVVTRRAIVNARIDAVDNTLQNLLVWSGIGLLLMALVSVGVGWLFAGRALRPVHIITSRARRISAASLEERLALEGPHDELREMAETFDSLLDRIQEAFESERRLVATMSHELRTPLANQRTALEVAIADADADAPGLRHAAEVALDQAIRAQRTVDALLALARAQAGAAPHPSGVVQLDQMVARIIADRRAVDDALDWQVQLEPVQVPGDAELLERAVDNMMGNAVLHNTAGGWVRVQLEVDSGFAVLQAENSGAVLDRDAVASFTTPFRRGVADRTSSTRGTGLGLTVVQAVADFHRAELHLEPLADGGLKARLSLPLAPRS